MSIQQLLFQQYGIQAKEPVYYNLSVPELVEHAILNREATLADNGALNAMTGKRTGRSPKDRYIVKEDSTAHHIWWGEVNIPIEEKIFESLYKKVIDYLSSKKLYVREVFAGADKNYRINIRAINELAWHNLFINNMFIRPTQKELENFKADFTIISAPRFLANPEVDGTRSEAFIIVNFKKRIVLIGGTEYAGEMKKSIFSILNYLLPQQGVFPMHCSANVGKEGDVAIFFGLSGTGKTTLSADPNRSLIGDDEHGWTDEGIFNFEGGCYAKCINLSKEKEPDIWHAIKFGSVLENIVYFPNSHTPDYSNNSITENTRTAYPLEYIRNAVIPSVGGIPKNIFFLTCDAFGVLPPISKLESAQAMYHYISGYTAKVAGTETGVTEPTTTFSACFGQPFLPLHPTKYAAMLKEKMEKYQTKVWLVNTGWSGGSYGVGSRMKLSYTRAMITAALEGKLDNVTYTRDPIFGLLIPDSVPGVPTELLNPRNTWADKEAYDQKANELAQGFIKNFERFADFATPEMLSAAPKVAIKV
ncbi:MAG: phosphoenolpyruvate carboxykinase (ATP) [Bacteroidia bacterium]|nr:phosphoenolpyruvate carboxykinase (ATP) [Bacteroidia bacterium]MDW8301536.1 phosphoenolpyruvate carboxykinase (ATP) [Bacteroidia bacterium]